MNSETLLFKLIQYTVAGKMLPSDFVLEEKAVEPLLTLARKFDVLQLAAHAITENSLVDANHYASLKTDFYKVCARMLKLETAKEDLIHVLNTEQIPFALLKGSILRDYYPKPWMRTSVSAR